MGNEMIREPRKWRTKREWLVEVARYCQGELMIQELSGDALVLLVERDQWQPGDIVYLVHEDGSVTENIVPPKKEPVHG